MLIASCEAGINFYMHIKLSIQDDTVDYLYFVIQKASVHMMIDLKSKELNIVMIPDFALIMIKVEQNNI